MARVRVDLAAVLLLSIILLVGVPVVGKLIPQAEGPLAMWASAFLATLLVLRLARRPR